MKKTPVVAVLALAGIAGTVYADGVQFGFRSRTAGVDVVGGEIVLAEDFTGTIQLALTGAVDPASGAYSLGGFGGAIGSSLAMIQSALTFRQALGLPLDFPSGNEGMLFPFRSLFQGGDGNDAAPENAPGSLVGFDSAVAGTPAVGRFTDAVDVDPRVGYGDNDLYYFEVSIDAAFVSDTMTYTSYTGVDNITQLIYDLGGGLYRYEVTSAKDAELVIRRIPAPGALALLGLGGLVAARRRRA